MLESPLLFFLPITGPVVLNRTPQIRRVAYPTQIKDSTKGAGFPPSVLGQEGSAKGSGFQKEREEAI